MADVFTERDPISPITYSYAIQKVLYQGKSAYQDIMVFENPFFGRVLVLDGVVQLTEWDEHFYHEMLAHVPLCAHGNPRRVLLIGGGDGGTLREILRHPEVEEATLVEIDRAVVDVSRQYFPRLAASFDDPRARVVIEEGSAFLQRQKVPYDAILVDCTDPVGPAQNLSTEAFYRMANSALAADGMLVSQTESLHFHKDFVRSVQQKLALVFPIVDLYTMPLATYAGNWWTFSIASKVNDPRQIRKHLNASLRHYSPEVHQWSFCPRTMVESLLAGDAPE